MSTASVTAASIKGLTGTVRNVRLIKQASDSTSHLSALNRSEDIDLNRMAQWSLRYLTESPRKHLNYDPVFQCFTYQCPPAPEGTDPIVPCDTDARMDWEWYYMRDITGSDMGRDVEKAFHKRMLSYVDDNGYVWSAPGCFYEGNVDAVYKKSDYIIHIWGATKILTSLSEDYHRTNNPKSKALARKIMLMLKKLAVWDAKGRCWILSGMGGMHPDGTVALPTTQPAPLVEALINYWLSTGDAEALDFARAYADGIIEGLQPGSITFAPDGNFGSGHGHMTMHAVWGIAHLGIVTGEKRYVEFAKRSWDWMLSRGTGTGWFPAAPAWASTCTEVCLISDMMSTASYIALDGHPEYYDYIERYMRNYIGNLQFIATPEFETKYREINKAQGKEKVENGLVEVRKFQGGFYNAGLNDFENSQLGGAGYVFKIAGCCAPEGMRAVYTTWLNTICKHPNSPLGPSGVYVNMCFSRDSEWGTVSSFLPDEGRLSVTARVSDRFYIRPPHWAERDAIRAFQNSKQITPKWSGDYLQFSASAGDTLSITYPIIRFEHTVSGLWPSVPDLKMGYLWEGNSVVGVYPKPKPGMTPLITSSIRHTPSIPS
ncbi:MAG: glycoside hydrolase family protein [Armatimonadota bacterium]